MRLPEQKLYDWLQRKVGHVAMLERVENRVGVSTPDLYFASWRGPAVNGWIELKCLERLPVRATTIVRLENWTTGQRYWALRHAAHGGRTWLMLQIQAKSIVLLVNAAKAATAEWTRDEWLSNSITLNQRNADADSILDALRAT